MTGILIPSPAIMHRSPRPPRRPNPLEYVRMVLGFALFVFILLTVGTYS